MNCLFCEVEGSRGQLHAHMAKAHADQVKTWMDEKTGRMYWAINCPLCAEHYRRFIKPRSGDASFMEEFIPEIRLVACDVLLHHYTVDHLLASMPEESEQE